MAESQKALDAANVHTPEQVRQRASAMTVADWAKFAAEWRQTYYTFTRTLAANPGAAPYKTVDEHHLDSLKDLLVQYDLQGLWTEEQVHDMSLVWHRLDPWPDTVEGIKTLNTKFQTSTLSNGNVKLLTDMAQHAKLDWTHVLSSEMFKSYKPDPKVYLGAAEKLGLQPEQCAMVAAHLNDLKAAKGCGFRTVYVTRRQEEQWDPESERKQGYVDVWVEENEHGFLTAAEKLGNKS